MRKKTSIIVAIALALAVLLLAAQSCVKKNPYFRFRYAIVQILSDGQPTRDSVISQSGVSLRIWIVPERYFDRFAFNPADLLVTKSYAASIDLGSDAIDKESNDSLIAFELWRLPANKGDYVDSVSLAPFAEYKVQDADQWMSEVQAVSYFNQKCFENKLPQYIDVRFNKFTHFTGSGFYSFKLYTRSLNPNFKANIKDGLFLYSTSNIITLTN